MSENYVVFGASDTANKAIIVGRTPNGPGRFAVLIADLRGTHEFGDTDFSVDDLGAAYTTMYFCKRESLDALIKALESARDMWAAEGDIDTPHG